MSSHVYNQLLERLQETVSDIFFVQIGALDGVTFDPIGKYVKRFEWSGLLVEPIREHYETLKQNYHGHDNLIFENVAIADEVGERTMARIPSDVVKKHNLPEWSIGISSFSNDRNAVGGKGCSEALYRSIKPHLVEEKVNCVPLPNLLRMHEVVKVDLLQIDAEGHDYQILKQFDFKNYHPLIVNLEFTNLPEDEQSKCLEIFSCSGYRVTRYDEELVATKLE